MAGTQVQDPIDLMNSINDDTDNINSTNDLINQNQVYNTSNEISMKQEQLMKIKNDKLNSQLSSLKDIENNIINKDRFIDQTSSHIEKNDTNIYILYISLFLSLALFLSIILYSIGQLSNRLLNIVIVIIIVIFLCLVLYTYNIFHFATIVHFIDNRKNLNLAKSVKNLQKKLGVDLQEQLYGDKKDFIDENCLCEDSDEIYTDEEDIGVSIKPGYFYYDKTAPKQYISPDAKSNKINVSSNINKKIYDKVDWVNHDTKTYENDVDDKSSYVKSYRINPNNYDVYKNGTLVGDSTYSVNI